MSGRSSRTWCARRRARPCWCWSARTRTSWASSRCASAVISRQLINIPDLYELDQPGKNPWGFHHDKQFDRKTGYQGRSMLTVPMINQRDEVIGVIQLINKRRDGAPKLLAPADFTEWVV